MDASDAFVLGTRRDLEDKPSAAACQRLCPWGNQLQPGQGVLPLLQQQLLAIVLLNSAVASERFLVAGTSVECQDHTPQASCSACVRPDSGQHKRKYAQQGCGDRRPHFSRPTGKP